MSVTWGAFPLEVGPEDLLVDTGVQNKASVLEAKDRIKRKEAHT